MIVWEYAYRQARKGDWQTLALDRYRFQTRIHNVEKHLCEILQADHRDFIYTQRFQNTD